MRLLNSVGNGREMAANISVKAVPAYGLHWTSRKRVAFHLKR
jgi:hypothetical protein